VIVASAARQPWPPPQEITWSVGILPCHCLTQQQEPDLFFAPQDEWSNRSASGSNHGFPRHLVTVYDGQLVGLPVTLPLGIRSRVAPKGKCPIKELECRITVSPRRSRCATFDSLTSKNAKSSLVKNSTKMISRGLCQRNGHRRAHSRCRSGWSNGAN
jgi:hypothetical protein